MRPVLRVCQKCGTEIPADAPEGGCPGCLLETALDAVGGEHVFGRYTLIKVLGRGGMGIVWLARDEELERHVALKFLPDLMIHDHAFFDQLRRETKRCLELTHPHIVRIHDFIRDERSGCISMEYIDGETLSNLRVEKEQRVFNPEEIATWIKQLCDALHYAHNRANVVHCDLKPANLMVNQRGDLKITDFGIARSLADSVGRLTMQQSRGGTLVYMSPQQLNGQRYTPLDDIYSLGATIYELLTSKPPFYSGNIDRQICERVASSLAERRKEFNIEPASVRPAWEQTVAACLAKEPAQRPQSAAEVAERLQLAPAQTATTGPHKKPNRKALLVGSIAALSIIALASLYVAVLKQHVGPLSHAAARIPEKSIAILPFENLSADQENAYFTYGVQDEILTNLAKVADLKVISRTSVLKYKSGGHNLRQVAKELRVAHVLEGSVQRAGSRVRVSAQLIDARSDKQLWAERYDRDLSDVFAIETDLAQHIVSQLRAKLSSQEQVAIKEKPTGDLAAYDRYVRAKALIGTSVFSTRERENLLEAARLLDDAVARDPAFLLAYCELARTHDKIYILGLDHTPSRLSMADSAIKRAVQLRPNAGEVHLAVATHLYCGYLDYDGARRELAIASRALPNEPLVFELAGFIDRRQGRWEESIRDLQRALELDPRNVYLFLQISITYEHLRRYAEMAEVLDRALEVAPEDVGARVMRAFVDFEWRADTRPLHSTIQTVIAEDPNAAGEIAESWMNLALCERDWEAAQRALAATNSDACRIENVVFPRNWCEGVLARLRGDNAAAHAAFTFALAESEKITRDQPAFGEAFCALGMIEAALGMKEKAISAGTRAVELVPISKDAINGPLLLEYLALIYAWTGEKDHAIEKLTQLAQIPSTVNYGVLRLHPYWDPLRGDPRFEKIVASLAPR
jgi:serine/threonine protein kinase/Tfp pilus assembly protein PilF